MYNRNRPELKPQKVQSSKALSILKHMSTKLARGKKLIFVRNQLLFLNSKGRVYLPGLFF
ncbi:MAG: hypothetical protein D6814_11115 [Calditrichaeota bacterium]|nr:MAG: hypothetical protein D6814_11115 [Calditrichota bacterium]